MDTTANRAPVVSGRVAIRRRSLVSPDNHSTVGTHARQRPMRARVGSKSQQPIRAPNASPDHKLAGDGKVERQGSYQDYPVADSPPRTQTVATNVLGYDFFGDCTYALEFTFPHSQSELTLEFSSSLFEGKGVADESWGLDNIWVQTATIDSAHAAEGIIDD